MATFPFCHACAAEYRQPQARRFHAQTNACSDCGPRIWVRFADGGELRETDAALVRVVAALRQGRIVAVRGVGGYQLLVDATNEAAVSRLRVRKGRRAKPLAVLVDSQETAARLAVIDPQEQQALVDRANPIVLVTARHGTRLAASVHPQLNQVGLLLPTTPLHAILASRMQTPLVCTSGNREGEPLEMEVEAGEDRLNGIADLWLHHDRPIARAIDDSVVRVIAGRRVTLRLARGLGPLPLELPRSQPVFALGGFLKAALAWSNGVQSVLGPHCGDQQTVLARERYAAQYHDARQLYQFEPEGLIHDMHPDYPWGTWCGTPQFPRRAVQHHHAHVAAGMLEHGWLDRTVLGVAWDGTGYGPDGTIWGGEFLVATAGAFQRLARFRPFPLLGGEQAIHEPWRVAYALLADVAGIAAARAALPRRISDSALDSLEQLRQRPRLAPVTSSAGRLFDAAAVLTLGMTHAEFDGHAAMCLEAVADRTATGQYDAVIRGDTMGEVDWRPVFAAMLKDREAGVEAPVMATKFHRGLASAIVQVCRARPDLPVVVTGGVFQNRLLTEWLAEAWDRPADDLGLPGTIPPNDGGLAAGQLAVAAAQEDWLCA